MCLWLGTERMVQLSCVCSVVSNPGPPLSARALPFWACFLGLIVAALRPIRISPIGEPLPRQRCCHKHAHGLKAQERGPGLYQGRGDVHSASPLGGADESTTSGTAVARGGMWGACLLAVVLGVFCSCALVPGRGPEGRGGEGGREGKEEEAGKVKGEKIVSWSAPSALGARGLVRVGLLQA